MAITNARFVHDSLVLVVHDLRTVHDSRARFTETNRAQR